VQNVAVALRAAGPAHPAQTIVGITGLAVLGCLIEIECTAVLG
jgi:enamine deaminase RidA (YjgF/YER057c/UK114 family)